jgi:hypothetical protein
LLHRAGLRVDFFDKFDVQDSPIFNDASIKYLLKLRLETFEDSIIFIIFEIPVKNIAHRCACHKLKRGLISLDNKLDVHASKMQCWLCFLVKLLDQNLLQVVAIEVGVIQ